MAFSSLYGVTDNVVNLTREFAPNFAPANSGFTSSNADSSGAPDISGLSYVDRTNLAYNAYQTAEDRKFNAEQAELSRRFNAEEAQKTRDWQEQMSNSAYSRAIADLKSAGINPYALLSGMNASSTPSGATGSGSSAYSNSHTGSYTSGVTSGNNARTNATNLLGKAVSNAFDLYLLAKLIL